MLCGVLYMFLQRHVAVCIACKTSSCIHTTQISMWNGCAGLYHPDFQLLLAQHQVLLLVLLLERHTLQLQAFYLNSTDCPTYPFTVMSYIHVSLPPLTWLELYMYGYKPLMREETATWLALHSWTFAFVGCKSKCHWALHPACRGWSQDASPDKPKTCIFSQRLCSPWTAARWHQWAYMFFFVGGRQYLHGGFNPACPFSAFQVLVTSACLIKMWHIQVSPAETMCQLFAQVSVHYMFVSLAGQLHLQTWAL